MPLQRATTSAMSSSSTSLLEELQILLYRGERAVSAARCFCSLGSSPCRIRATFSGVPVRSACCSSIRSASIRVRVSMIFGSAARSFSQCALRRFSSRLAFGDLLLDEARRAFPAAVLLPLQREALDLELAPSSARACRARPACCRARSEALEAASSTRSIALSGSLRSGR